MKKSEVDRIMRACGFERRMDYFDEGYVKTMRMCNSNCIGCEYHLYMTVVMCDKDRDAAFDQYNADCFGVFINDSREDKVFDDETEIVSFIAKAFLYKQVAYSDEDDWETHGNTMKMPNSKIVVYNTKDSDLKKILCNLGMVFAKVMQAMDYSQIEGMDFIDLSQSTRVSVLSDMKTKMSDKMMELSIE